MDSTIVPLGRYQFGEVSIDLDNNKVLIGDSKCQQSYYCNGSEGALVYKAVVLIIAHCKKHYPNANQEAEASALLKAVCEYVKDEKDTADCLDDIKGEHLTYLEEIPGLLDWWRKHKPKTLAETRREKLTALLDTVRVVDTHKLVDEIEDLYREEN